MPKDLSPDVATSTVDPGPHRHDCVNQSLPGDLVDDRSG